MESLPNPLDYEHYFNAICSNLEKSIEINLLTFSYSNMREKMLCFYSKSDKFTDEDPVLVGNMTKHLGKKVKLCLKLFELNFVVTSC